MVPPGAMKVLGQLCGWGCVVVVVGLVERVSKLASVKFAGTENSSTEINNLGFKPKGHKTKSVYYADAVRTNNP